MVRMIMFHSDRELSNNHKPSNEWSGIQRTITEPSAVAPDGKVYVGHKLGNTLNTQLDFSIRRYRARFCNGSA